MSHVFGADQSVTLEFTPERWNNLYTKADAIYGKGEWYILGIYYFSHRAPWCTSISVAPIGNPEEWTQFTENGMDWLQTDVWDAPPDEEVPEN